MKIQRTLSPTAATLPVRTLLSASASLLFPGGYVERLEREVREVFHARDVFALSSGKAAITLTLRALQTLVPRRKVIIPAFTCYSVPSAIIRAGLKPVACDVNPETLDFDLDQLSALLDEDTLCVLPTHLFGRPSDVDAVGALSRPKGVVVVEDAAQAMGGTSDGRLLGTIGDVGIFSLGRGKNISSGGGGLILTNSPTIGRAIRTLHESLPGESKLTSCRTWLEQAATEVFIRPSCYWLPSGLPFLGLGDTKFETGFPMKRMGETRAATLVGWFDRLQVANQDRQERARLLMRELAVRVPEVTVVTSPESCCLRVPILLRDRAAKQKALSCGFEKGLGISGSYPGTVLQIPELSGELSAYHCPGAGDVVARLVTLPTHRFVEARDRRMICEVLEEVCSGSRPSTSRRLSTTGSSAVSGGGPEFI